MFDVITFGSATWDFFLDLKDFKVIEDEDFLTGEGICFNLGSKVNVEEVSSFVGGGGTNTAVTFANQDLKVAYCGAIGDDFAGREITEALKERGVESQLQVVDETTNHSVVLTSEGADRTILAYRGAAEMLDEEKVDWDKLKAKWFYLAPLSGELGQMTDQIVDYTNENDIKVAFNPGNSQLEFSKSRMDEILNKVEVLLLNQEEASQLTGISYEQEEEIFKEIDRRYSGIVVITKGDKGVVVSDGENLYRGDPLPADIKDKTGAGDSFGSGFVTGLIEAQDIEYAVQLGIANATACLEEKGAKNGLLEEEEFRKTNVEKIKLT